VVCFETTNELPIHYVSAHLKNGIVAPTIPLVFSLRFFVRVWEAEEMTEQDDCDVSKQRAVRKMRERRCRKEQGKNEVNAMQNFLRRLSASWIGTLLVLALIGPAFAGPPGGRVVVFGDSLSDPGNFYAIYGTVTVPPFQSLIPSAPYAIGGYHFSNGPTWIEQISLAGPAYRKPGVFFNYAVGEAHAAGTGPYDLTGQVLQYLADVGGKENPDAEYVVWIGGEDVRGALQALATDPSGTQSGLILQAAISAIQNNLLLLYERAGARKFLVPNLPDLGLAPAVVLQGATVQYYATDLTQQFNAALEQLLSSLQASLNVQIARFDVFALHHEVDAAPASFGLSDVLDACIRLNTTVQPYCANPGKYLFWDGIHPTVAGHRIIAERAAAVLGIVWPLSPG
jgi:phospholipase/lecithinase/hemolysin